MPKKKSDAVSIEWSMAVLGRLGCPGIQRAEGTDAWERSKGTYALTPDLVAGPFLGAGDPSDFYIDVFEPTGDQFVNVEAGNPQAAVALLRASVEPGTVNLTDIGDTDKSLYDTMNKKLLKYAGRRQNTPMLGLAMYFTMTGNQPVGPALMGYLAPLALNRAFGIDAHHGQGTMHRIMKGIMDPIPSEGGAPTFVVSLPMDQPIGFILYVARKSDGPRVILLVNYAVMQPTHPYPDHPVIIWLRSLAAPKLSNAVRDGRTA